MPQLFKAVCYRCSYEGADSQSSHCPSCHFPVILESETTPAGGAKLETILRSSAPLLPGVDTEPRQAQMMAEARRHRIAVVQRVPRMRTQPAMIVAAGLRRLKVAVICASAVAAGAVAAVINHSLL